jgi:hypothetical protein
MGKGKHHTKSIPISLVSAKLENKRLGVKPGKELE